MNDVLFIKDIAQLKPFLNDNNFLELAIRGVNKKFTAFQKIALNDIADGEGKEMMQKAINLLNKNNKIAEKNLNVVSHLADLQKISLVLNGLNLCATCVGFAIMYAKLDKISEQIDHVVDVMKNINEVNVDFEFNKVLSEHSNMLDSRKTQKYYTEKEMRKLVDDEYNVLNVLIKSYLKGISEDEESIIFAIYSLASMMTVSIRYFDEIYYFNNKEAIGDGDKWHSSHDKWMSVFEVLSSDDFVNRIQDFAILEKKYSTEDADVFYLSLYYQVKEMQEDIIDNQSIIELLDDEETLSVYSNYVRDKVMSEIQNALDNVDGAKDNADVINACDDALKQLAFN